MKLEIWVSLQIQFDVFNDCEDYYDVNYIINDIIIWDYEFTRAEAIREAIKQLNIPYVKELF
jgi:hypothetical protein